MSNLPLQSLLLVLLFFGANAVRIQPTQKMEALEGKIGADPRPTARAVMAHERWNLVDRQNYNTVCGYVNGNINNPVTCGGGYVCATANHYYGAGCCNPNELSLCDPPSTCIPYGGICNAVCQAGAWTSCGYLTPYCFTKVFEYGSPYYEYDCATAPGVITILPTVTGIPHSSTVTPPVAVTHTAVTPTQTSPSTTDSPPHSSTVPLFGTQPTAPSTIINPPTSNIVTSAAATNTIVSSPPAPVDPTSPSSTNVAQPNSVPMSSPPMNTPSKVSSTPATPVGDSGGTATGVVISCGSDSQCGNGQGSSGNGNGNQNGKSGASMRTRSPCLSVLVALVYVGVLIFL